MTFIEFINEAQDNGVLVARASSGHSFCGETAALVSVGDVFATIRTESGKRLRVKDVYGKAEIAGKYGRYYFVANVERMSSDNFFENSII